MPSFGKKQFWRSKGVISLRVTQAACSCQALSGSRRRSDFSILNSSLLKTLFLGKKNQISWPILTLKSAIPNNLWVAFKSGQHHGKRADFHTILFPVNSSLQRTEVYSRYEIQLGLFCLRRSLSDRRQESGKGTHFKRLGLQTFRKLMCFEFCGLIIHKHATGESILSTSSAY